jgi:hypothetical protein
VPAILEPTAVLTHEGSELHLNYDLHDTGVLELYWSLEWWNGIIWVSPDDGVVYGVDAYAGELVHANLDLYPVRYHLSWYAGARSLDSNEVAA